MDDLEAPAHRDRMVTVDAREIEEDPGLAAQTVCLVEMDPQVDQVSYFEICFYCISFIILHFTFITIFSRLNFT